MQVFDNLSSFKAVHQHCVATIGKYDGMHLGHQSILNQLLQESQRLNVPSVVILSEPQPEEFFAKDNAPVRLNAFHDKVNFLKSYGIDAVYRLNFDLKLSQLSAETFIDELLVAGLGIKSLIVGDDFRFGKNRQGDFSLLKAKGVQAGFNTLSINACSVDNERISSTLIRELLSKGECQKVKTLLGRFYSVSGEVVKGKQLGRTLGVPTANISLSALPLQGVFSVKVCCNNKQISGVASIGYNPTIAEQKTPILEVNLFDFAEDIYGETLTVSFVQKIRDEEKFSDLELLKKQMLNDIVVAKRQLSLV